MGVSSTTPHLLRAARGEVVDRPPVWMMRQAGRYMKAYRDLRDKYPSFRDRSEIPDVAIEVSLQPWKAFGPDGVILFSDIVTPLPGLGIDMDIAEGKGPNHSLAPPHSRANRCSASFRTRSSSTIHQDNFAGVAFRSRR